MENFEKCTVAMLGGPCSQHVTGNTSRQNQPQSAIMWQLISVCRSLGDNKSNCQVKRKIRSTCRTHSLIMFVVDRCMGNYIYILIEMVKGVWQKSNGCIYCKHIVWLLTGTTHQKAQVFWYLNPCTCSNLSSVSRKLNVQPIATSQVVQWNGHFQIFLSYKDIGAKWKTILIKPCYCFFT